MRRVFCALLLPTNTLCTATTLSTHQGPFYIPFFFFRLFLCVASCLVFLRLSLSFLLSFFLVVVVVVGLGRVGFFFGLFFYEV